MIEVSERGLDFVRIAIAKAATRNAVDAELFAAERWGRASIPARALKASVGTSEPGSPGWGSELVTLAQPGAEFFAIVSARSILGPMQNLLRRMPLATPALAATGGSTAYWIGEAGTKIVSEAAFNPAELSHRKLASLCVFTDDLLRAADPSAEQSIRNDLVRAAVEALDTSFADPGQIGSAGIQPASVTSSAAPIAATGDLDADLRAVIASFGGDLGSAFWIMRPETAVGIHSPTHQDIEATGGTLLGIPVVTSRSLSADSSPDTHTISLLDASAVAYGEGVAEIRASREALIDMGGGEKVSLYQKNAVAVLAERAVNWSLMHSDAVAVLQGLTF